MAPLTPEDPFVSAEIERAVEPYAAGLRAEEVAWLKEELRQLLGDDAAARELLSRAHPRSAVDHSGEQLRPGAPPDSRRSAVEKETG